MAVQTTSNWGKSLTPGIKAWYGDAYKEKPEVGLTIFQHETSGKNFEEFVGTTGFGLYPVKTEGSNMSFDTMQQGFVSRFTHVVYQSGFIVTREMHDDEQYNIMKQMSQASAFSGRASRETVLANVLNRSQTAGYTGGDGSTLASTTHGNKSGGTYSNQLTTGAALSETSLENGCINVSDYTNDRGIKIQAMPRKLIVTTSNQFEAPRILKSTNQNDSANNAINALRAQNAIPEGFVVWSYLTDADAWYLLTDVPYGLIYVERDKDEFGGAPENDFDNDNARYKNRQRYSAGWADPRGIQVSVP